MRPKNLKFPFTWEERKPALHDGVLIVPQYFKNHSSWGFPGWKTYFDTLSRKFSVEYCSGNGDWIVQRALSHPEINWIAVEKKFPRVRKIWSKMKNYRLKNLLIVCGKAENFTKYYLPENSIEQIFINFPDPWPKAKHGKHRLIQQPFVHELSRISKNGAIATCLTDDASYRDQMIAQMQQGHWKSFFSNPHYICNWENYGSSWFQKLWEQKGRDFYYMQFKK